MFAFNVKYGRGQQPLSSRAFSFSEPPSIPRPVETNRMCRLASMELEFDAIHTYTHSLTPMLTTPPPATLHDIQKKN